MATLNVLQLLDFTNVNDTAITGTPPVLQEIALAGDTSWVNDTANTTHTGIAQFTLEDVNSDLGNVDTLFIRLRYANSGTPSLNTWNSLSARVLKSDGTTPLTNAVTVVSGPITTTTPTNSSLAQFTGVDTAASQADWNDAVVQISFAISKSMAGDTIEERVFAAELTGTYTVGAAEFNGTGSASLAITASGAGNYQPAVYNGTGSASLVLTASGTGSLAGGGPEITRVQTGTGWTAGGTSFAVTLGATPTEGNLLVAVVFTRATAATGPSGWTRVVTSDPSVSFVNDCAIWVKVAGASESTSYTWTFATNAGAGVIREYASSTGWLSVAGGLVDTEAFVDAVAASTSKSSGTTATTAEAVALAVAGFGVRTTVSSQSFSNSFGDLAQTVQDSGNVSHTHLVDKLLSEVAAQETTMSWTTSGEAGGVIGVFLPVAGTGEPEGTGSASLVLTATGEGNYEPAVYNGTASASLALTASGAGNFAPPGFNGQGSAVLVITATGEGDYEPAVYNGTGTASLALTAAAAGNFAPAGFNGQGSANLTLTATGDGNFEVAVYSGSGTASLVLTATGQGDAGVPTWFGAGSAALVLTATGTGDHEPPEFSGTGSAQLNLTASGAGSFAPAGFNGQGSASLTLTTTGTGDYEPAEYAGQGSANLVFSASGVGHTFYDGTGSATLVLTATGTGTEGELPFIRIEATAGRLVGVEAGGSPLTIEGG
jgi:hypothetical protein